MEQIGLIVLVPLNHPMTESGLIECDGRSLSISEYSDLYTVIGNKYGADEETFNVPQIESADGIKYGIVFTVIAAPPYIPGDEVYTNPDSSAAISAIVKNATEFGQGLINRFTLENIGMGVTQAGKTYALTMFCHKLIHFLSVGSLYAALQEAAILLADTSQAKTDLSPFLTNNRLNEYKEHIEDYLGM